jgi:hypothetical protein
MSPDILRGYSFSRPAARYRDHATGRFVARTRITTLLEQQVDSATRRMGDIVQGLANGEIAPGTAQLLLRDEVRRLSLSNTALGKGGFDRLTAQDYGRVGRQLRDTYQRTASLVRDVQSGRVSLSQALNRVEGYALDARRHFFAAERETLRASGRRYEERRTLHARESCRSCIGYAAMGWVPAFTLPLPGEGNTECRSYCRCTIERREVVEEVQAAFLERSFA